MIFKFFRRLLHYLSGFLPLRDFLLIAGLLIPLIYISNSRRFMIRTRSAIIPIPVNIAPIFMSSGSNLNVMEEVSDDSWAPTIFPILDASRLLIFQPG